MARSSSSRISRFIVLCIALFLVAQLHRADAAPLAKRKRGRPSGGGRGGPGGRPDAGNSTRPNFNGARPDGGPGGPSGSGGRGGPRFGVPVDRLLSTVSAGCLSAANSTSFDACKPDNATLAGNVSKDTFKDAECSAACNTAVRSYYTALKTACGSEVLVAMTPRNETEAARNMTAAGER